MSNDLISRNTLLEELREKVYPEKFGQRCNALDVIGAVLQVIGEQPIAYDVDRIVGQLETRRSLLEVARIPKSAKSATYTAYSLAIEDIRKGGINEDE